MRQIGNLFFVDFRHVLSPFNLRERIHNPVSVKRTSFMDKRSGFLNKNLNILSVIVHYFITAQNTIVRIQIARSVKFLETVQTGYSLFLN